MKKWMIVIWICSFVAVPVTGQERYDVIIDEIMADPSPVVGLPNNEWIEIKNVSTLPVNLRNWRLGDLTGISGPFPNYILFPDSFLILCSSGSLASMSLLGPSMAITNFPSLDNTHDELFLRSATGKTIHGVGYYSSLFNDIKKEGGWSLEMIDTGRPCIWPGNWSASIYSAGGSPGKRNSVDANVADVVQPQVESVYSLSNASLIIKFNEPLDSTLAADKNKYVIDGGLMINVAVCIAPLFDRVRLDLSSSMDSVHIYELKIAGLYDCSNNRIVDVIKRTGIPHRAKRGEWIINEILFDPLPGGTDYVELVNNGDHIVDAGETFIANRDLNGSIVNIKKLSDDPYYLLPDEIVAITGNKTVLLRQHFVPYPDRILETDAMPSYPADKGTVVTTDMQGDVIDEVRYESNWHFQLITDTRGVALERLDRKGNSNDKSNWHSASSTSGYGTPGYKNSQLVEASEGDETINIVPMVFSPDNDGMDDVLTINYQLPSPGFMVSLKIFDLSGRVVCHLVNNQLAGIKGKWLWNGLGDNSIELEPGIYILYAEFFDISSKRIRTKTPFALVRPFQ